MKHLLRRLLAGSCVLPLLLAGADWAETIRPVLTGKVKHLKLEKKIYRTDRRTTITGLKDVTIDGNGATLLMSRKDHIFKIEDCTNFTIRNLTLDFDPMIFTQVKITRVSADGRTIEFEVEKGYPDLVPDLIANESLEVFLPDGTLRTDLGRLSGKPEILTPRRGRMRVRLSGTAPLRIGDRIPIGRRFANVIQTVGGRGHTFENLTIHGSGCFAIGMRYSAGDDRILRCRVIPGPRPKGAETDRIRSTNGDGFNISFARNYPHIIGCEIRNSNDDSINFHAGAAMRLIPLEKENGTFRIIRPFAVESERMTALFPPGDTALLLRRDLGFAPVGKVGILSCAPSDYRATLEELAEGFDRAKYKSKHQWIPTAYEIRLDTGSLPLKGDLHLQPLPNGRPFRIAENYFHDHRARGMRIMVPDGVIENNTIERVTDAAISLGAEFEYWNEAGWVEDVTIRNNVIRNVGKASIPRGDSYVCGAICSFVHLKEYRKIPRGHARLSILNNRISDSPGAGIALCATRDSVVSGNIIENTAYGTTVPGSRFGFRGLEPVWLIESGGITGKNIIDGRESIIGGRK